MTVRCIVRVSSVAACAALLAVVLVWLGQAPRASAADEPPAEAPHQVIVCYFHRTVRCPTCKRISAYIEESVKTGFASQVKDGGVKMAIVDFRDAKNQKYAKAYRITGPTLVLMDVHGGKVTAWKPAPKVWSLVGNKDAFFRYVQGEVRSYLEGKKKTAS